jgi:tetrahydromethanopterin S-methyltransferase subunit B
MVTIKHSTDDSFQLLITAKSVRPVKELIGKLNASVDTNNESIKPET